MTRLQAHALLNAAKRGEPVPYEAITEALRATGDIADAQPFVGGAQPVDNEAEAA